MRRAGLLGRYPHVPALVQRRHNKPTVCPSVAPRNLLWSPSLPSNLSAREPLVRRRNDDTGVGPASTGMGAGLGRFPRRVPVHGGASGRVRGALATRAGARGRLAPRAPLSPGAAGPWATQACRGPRGAGRGRALGPARGPRPRPWGASPVGARSAWARGRAAGSPRGRARLGAAPLPAAGAILGGRAAPLGGKAQAVLSWDGYGWPHPPARTRADVPAVSRDEHHGGLATAGVAHGGGLVPLGLPAPPGQRLRCRSVPPAGGRTADGSCTRPSRGLSGMPGNVHVQFGGQGAGGIPLP